jgi:hypothetical protein
VAHDEAADPTLAFSVAERRSTVDRGLLCERDRVQVLREPAGELWSGRHSFLEFGTALRRRGNRRSVAVDSSGEGFDHTERQP